MNEIKEDLKAIRADVTAIKVDVAKNTTSLDHHIRRTDMLQHIVTALIICILGACIKLLVG